MSTYIKHGESLEFDNAPLWLQNYMQYRLTILNNTDKSVMTYFKNMREFLQWASIKAETGKNPKDPNSLRSHDITNLPISVAVALTKEDIEAYLFFLRNYLNNEAATRNKKLISIRSFYDYVLDHQEALGASLLANPASRIKSPKTPQKIPVYLPEADQKAFLSNITGENHVRDQAIFLLFLSTGMRLSEVVGLDIGDIDFDNSTIRIRHGKGDKERIAHLTLPCAAAIQEYLEQYRSPIKELHTNALFVSRRYKDRLTDRSIENAMRKYTLRAKLGGKNYTPHKLRHTVATTLAKEGVDSLIIKEVLGHEDIGTTQIYMHLDQSDVAQAVSNSQLSILGSKEKSSLDDGVKDSLPCGEGG